MDYRFDLAPYFKSSNIIRITSNLVPQGFVADRRTILETTSKISEIINDIGEESARAQGLTKPVTTALKLRNSDHVVYLMADKSGKNISIIGFLKVGTKNLYVFDESGETKQVSSPCVLDFYIHESKQRSGLGKELFQTMLNRENVIPVKMAIDRPSDKLVQFLRKHYGLDRKIPQMNNFVVYDGFFNAKPPATQLNDGGDRRMHLTASPNTALFGPHFIADECKKRVINRSQQNSPSLSFVQNSPMGRFGAPRPTCSMAEIIHSSPTPMSDEPNSYHHNDHLNGLGNKHQHQQHHQHHQAADEDEEIKITIEHNHNNNNGFIFNDNILDHTGEQLNAITENFNNIVVINNNNNNNTVNEKQSRNDNELEIENNHVHHSIIYKPPNHFPLSKQHTGLKNISYNVGAAVSPTDKMEFIPPTESITENINRKLSSISPAQNYQHNHLNVDTADDAVSTVSSEGFTDQGYFDLKFYHNKLW